MIKNLLILVLIQNFIISECGKGCLKCNSNQNCILCDILNFYILQQNSCQQITVEQCLKINSSGICAQCKEGFFVESSTKKCVKITADKEVSFCQEYSSSQTCTACKRRFYLSGGKCLPVEVVIPTCQFYRTATTCLDCEKNYILSEDNTSCKLGSGEAYCQYYTPIKCIQCVDGYVLNYDLVSKQIFKYSGSSAVTGVINYMNQVSFEKTMYYQNSPQICQKVEVTNCVKPSSATTCQQCADNYYLDVNSICLKFPEPKIDFCEVYNQAFQCIECQNQYFLRNQTCVPVEKIENCQYYDGKQTSTFCKECFQNYYLKGQVCVMRNTTIQNCEEHEAQSEICKKCIGDFQLSTDGLKCFSSINNCKTYNNASSNSSITCQECNDGYFISNLGSTECSLGSVSNCLKYSSKNVCSKCQNQYFLQGSSCVKSIPINNCDIYSTKIPNSCEKCLGNHFNFILKSKCEINFTTSNCKIFNEGTQGTCKQCSAGYALNGSQQCVKISIENCVEAVSGKCTACAQNYALDYKNISSPTCAQLPSTITQNCQITSLQNSLSNSVGILEAYCLACKENTIPVDHREQYMCLDNQLLYLYGITTSLLVSGCIKYNIDGQCSGCQSGLYLNSNYKCSNICQGTVFPILVGTTSNLGFISQYINYCEDSESSLSDSCAVAGPNSYRNSSQISSANSKYVCLKCKEGYLDVVKLKREINFGEFLQYSIVNPEYLTPPFIENPLATFASIECIAISSNNIFQINGQVSKTLVSNCQYYFMIGNSSDFGCLKCIHQYVGIPNENGYIQNCQLQQNWCQSDQYYGLDAQWERIFSCHACKDQNKIPFVAMASAELNQPRPYAYYPYSLQSIPWIVNKDANMTNITCQQPNKSSFGYGNNDLFVFPQHCGLGFINLRYTKGDNGNSVIQVSNKNVNDLAIFCVACKPGYSAVSLSSSFYPEIKVECQAISNCQVGSTWFNACSKCSQGYAYLWTTDEIFYNQCTETSDPNCFAVGSSGSIQLCRACKKGYNLNNNYICEQYTPPYCSSSTEFTIKSQYQSHPSYSYYHSQQGLGCSLCESGYTAVEVSSLAKNYFICTISPYLTQSQNSITLNSNYIPYCLYYSMENNLLHCYQCQQGYLYIDTLENKRCALSPTNCLVLTSDNQCGSCEEGYALVNYQCVVGSIPNCLTYNSNTNLTFIQCSKCSPDYYLTSNNDCLISDVKNCKNHFQNSSTRCQECLENHVLVSKENLDYCFPLPIEMNCSQGIIEEDQQYGASLECTKCQENAKLVSLSTTSTTRTTQCLAFHEITKCKVYNTLNSLTTNEFSCLTCEEEYYLSNNGRDCIERKYIDFSCTTYDPNTDQCLKCQDNFMLDISNQCVNMPSGVLGCRDYDSNANCISCDRNRYLSGGLCVEVQSESQIINCLYYENEQSCKVCNLGYFLESNSCVKANAANCKTYSNADTCETCESDFGLVSDSKGRVNCQKINKNNCDKFENTEGFPCIRCRSNYYPNNDGDCQIVTLPILNCQWYSGPQTCEACQSSYILNKDKNKCLNLSSIDENFDSNCLFKQNLAKCIVCREGAYFKEGQCVPCPEQEKCFKCNSLNPFQCEICTTGYSMDKDGNCKSNNVVSLIRGYDAIAEMNLISFILLVLLI